MNYNHPKYLSKSQDRIEHLRKIIAGRPVAILAAGPSIKELEKRIDELRDLNICYLGINRFFIQENYILQKIDKHFSIITVTLPTPDEGLLPPVLDKVINFLDRDDNNMLVSGLSNFHSNSRELINPDFNLQKFFDKYDKKLLFSAVGDDKISPEDDRPLHLMHSNSLGIMIFWATIGKASKIILFGADGYTTENTGDSFYHLKEYGVAWPLEALVIDTNKGFNPIVPICLQNIYKTYHVEPVPTLNCSEVSFLTPFPKVSYNDAFAFLSGNKNVGEVSDLRIPTASVIIPFDGDEKKLQYTLKNLKSQSYSNYETIVIKKSLNFLDEMKRALSLARGKYIFYCPVGDGYSDRDWINSCLEILENRPQISLVCGQSEDQLIDPTWRKKMFIYYWLKRKNYFPSNTLCVRKKVLEKCLFQSDNIPTNTEFESWLNFNLHFNIDGYLPAFIPTASLCHPHENKELESFNDYRHKINNYKYQLIFKKIQHRYKDGDNNILPGKFYLSVFLLYGITQNIKNKLPRPLSHCLNILKTTARKFYKK